MSPRAREGSMRPRLQSGRTATDRQASFDRYAACALSRPLNFTVSCPMKRLRVAPVALLALAQVLAASAYAAESVDNPAPCPTTADAVIDARISTNSTFGQLWEYHGVSGGAVTLRINYLLSPMGELSGSFNLDPGEINYALCVADAADFFSLPPEISGSTVPIDGPVLSISIKRRGAAKAVRLYDSRDLIKSGEAARFRRVWDRIFKPLPVRPAWNRGS